MVHCYDSRTVMWIELDDDSDRAAHSIYLNIRSSTRVKALERRTSPLMYATTGFKEHATMMLTVSISCIVVPRYDRERF